MLGDLVLLIYLYDANAPSTHISVLYKRLAALAFCTTRCGCTTVAQSSPSVRPSYNYGFAKFRKKSSLRSFIFRNFAKSQRVSGNLDERHCKFKQTIKSMRYGFNITKHFCNRHQ
jgi:hypothetical protein